MRVLESRMCSRAAWRAQEELQQALMVAIERQSQPTAGVWEDVGREGVSK